MRRSYKGCRRESIGRGQCVHRRAYATDELDGQFAGIASGTERSATGRLYFFRLRVFLEAHWLALESVATLYEDPTLPAIKDDKE
jgi:hypothetical protein